MGMPVVDFKTTDYIRITELGDLTFSKDFLDLGGNSPVRYVVAGTLLKYREGYLVNTRIVGVESKTMVASAQSFIPDEVASAVLGKSGHTPPIIPPVATSDAIMISPIASIIQA